MNPRFFASPPVFQHSAIMPGALILTALDLPVANELPRHDPPLVPRDDAVFLLTAAAEIEHALMVQYLFAAYSLRGTQQPAVDTLQQCLLQIAREEMGHLMTVQNLLHLLGGPLNFNREHAPYASDIYPFRFKLEPVTLDALAKYVMAESPRNWSGDEQQEIAVRANRSNDGVAVNHVGPIFASLQVLFRDELADEDFQLDTTGFQGNEEDWGQGRDGLIIRTFGGANVAAVRQAAYLALNEIVQQGEGEEDSANSHFQRFLLAYRAGRELFANGMPASTWPVAENPNTTPPPPQPLN